MRGGHVSSLLLVALACLLTSCANRRLADQEESFAPYQENKLGGVPLLEFVGRRTALLVAADRLVAEVSDQKSQTVQFEMTFKSEKLYVGSAAAIDRRGYFVTAAHCVDDGEIYLGFHGPTGELAIEPARIVWSGKPSAVEFDFALLHVDMQLDHVFKWAPGFESGDTVFGLGAGKDAAPKSERSDVNFQILPFAGTIGGSESKSHNGTAYRVVFHDSPIREGNSGGPLVGEGGGLIAINNARTRRWLKWFGPESKSTRGVRPDLQWLAELIARDRAELSK